MAKDKDGAPRRPKNSDTNYTTNGSRYWQEWVPLASGRKLIRGKNHGEWKRKRDDAIRLDALGIVITDSKFEDAFKVWMKAIVSNRPIKDSTLCQYERQWLHDIKPDKIIGYKLHEIKTIDIQQFIDRRKAKGASDSKMLQVMKLMGSFFRYIHEEGYIRRNPMTKVPKIKVYGKKKIVVFSDDEIKRLLGATEGNRLKFLFYLALGSGARDGELSALNHGAIDVESGTMHVTTTATVERVSEGKGAYAIGTPKTEEGFRDIPLSKTVLREYRMHRARQQEEYLAGGRGKLAADTPVFETTRRTRIRTAGFRHLLIKLCEAADVTYRKFHTFRDTYITKLVQDGEPIAVVQKLAGHASIEQTMEYVHVEDDRIKKTGLSIEKIF
ncbi:MAG: site-specific integrase [Clostridiales Family XIII bacterium]|jgi:integrase|nr:site-specific integrase [Clostridiales Family XIII bacterium]